MPPAPHRRHLREPLGVPGEVVYTVAPLLVADESEDADLAASPAVQLFCERAAAARSGFEPTPESLPALARLCRRLDGLPLAIELAAVRARSLGLEAMIERLDHRFSLFDAGSRHADERHQNLHNMVAWSYDLLSSNEQRLFDRLSVFSGSFDLPAVDSVCTVDGDPADLLFTLVDRSMVQVVDLDEPRYRLLETLREFGRDRLATRRRRGTRRPPPPRVVHRSRRARGRRAERSGRTVVERPDRSRLRQRARRIQLRDAGRRRRLGAENRARR